MAVNAMAAGKPPASGAVPVGRGSMGNQQRPHGRDKCAGLIGIEKMKIGLDVSLGSVLKLLVLPGVVLPLFAAPRVLAASHQKTGASTVKSSSVLTAARLENSIGTRSALGEGVPQNYAVAARWFRKAAHHGYAKAEYNLGSQYYFGQGLRQNYVRAAYWWKRAARQNIGAAQYNLGNLYYFGKGVPRDSQKAAFWWREAAGQGVLQARKNLGILKNADRKVVKAADPAAPGK